MNIALKKKVATLKKKKLEGSIDVMQFHIRWGSKLKKKKKKRVKAKPFSTSFIKKNITFQHFQGYSRARA